MADSVVEVAGVSKKYSRSLRKSMLYGLSDIGHNLLGRSSRPERLRDGEFWAVDDVSFDVAQGETLGLVGSNGSGKTTILKCLNGIFWPDRGKLTICGRVGALIAVGAGFHPLFTGRENIYINAAILGMTSEEVSERFDAIVDFAGVGDFIDTPVKFYSSGMYVRLGFAVASHCNPDILLIDEILSVGDMNFQRSCQRRIKELRDGGVSIVLVSHNMNQVLHVCDRVIYLANGRIVDSGKPAEMIEHYQRDNEARSAESSSSGEGEKLVVPGLVRARSTKEISIRSASVTNSSGEPQDTYAGGEDLHLRLEFESKVFVERPVLQIAVYREDGVACFVERTTDQELLVPDIEPGEGELTFCIPSIPLKTARYVIEVLISDQMAICAHVCEAVSSFRVVSGTPADKIGGLGMFSIPVRFALNGKTLSQTKEEGA